MPARTVDGRLDPLIKAAARHDVVDMLSAEPDLEETFLSFYYHSEGADPGEPTQRFTLPAAVLGARLLGWPTTT